MSCIENWQRRRCQLGGMREWKKSEKLPQTSELNSSTLARAFLSSLRRDVTWQYYKHNIINARMREKLNKLVLEIWWWRKPSLNENWIFLHPRRSNSSSNFFDSFDFRRLLSLSWTLKKRVVWMGGMWFDIKFFAASSFGCQRHRYMWRK